MNPLNSDQKQSILERINFIQVELNDLDDCKNITWQLYSKNREARRNVERIIENLANASIDICKIILAGETIEIPGTYQEIILRLGEQDIIDKNLASKIATLAKARNILAHQYLDLKWDLIKDLIKETPLFIPAFIKSLNM